MMTPRVGSSCLRTYAAIAPATRRTLSNVKSSAMRPRQPSVPNLIGVTRPGSLAMEFVKRSDQFVQLLLVEVLHYLADVLRLITRGDEQSVVGFHHDQVVHSNHGDKLSRSVDVITGSVQREDALARNQVAVPRSAFGVVVLMECGPGAEIVPSEIGWQAKDV